MSEACEEAREGESGGQPGCTVGTGVWALTAAPGEASGAHPSSAVHVDEDAAGTQTLNTKP